MQGLPGHPWKTGALVHGGIIQAGVPMHQGADWFDTRGYITRAVVLKTYYSDDSEWDKRGWAKNNVRGVHCDVRTYGRNSRPLWKVPVLQRTHGMHDEDIYIPRDSNQDLAGKGKLVTLPSGKTGPKPTPAENLDGDHVLVGFLEGNPDAPVILPFCLPHPSSKRELKASDGRVRRIRHAGVSIEWSEDGNLTIDASEAAKEKLGSSGAEQSNSGTGGTITIQTEDGSGATSSMVFDANGGVKILEGGGGFLELVQSTRIKLQDGVGDFLLFTESTKTAELSAAMVKLATAPREPIIKGDSYVTAETAWYGILSAYLLLVSKAIDEIAKGKKSDGNDIWAQGTAARTTIDAAGASGVAAVTGGLSAWTPLAAASKSLKTSAG